MKRFFASDFFYDFVRSPVALVSFLIVLFLILSAVFAGCYSTNQSFRRRQPKPYERVHPTDGAKSFHRRCVLDGH
jgi:hypothetical protein